MNSRMHTLTASTTNSLALKALTGKAGILAQIAIKLETLGGKTFLERVDI